MRKFIITAELRDLEKQVSLGEISYSKMIELLNEKADNFTKAKWNEACEKILSDISATFLDENKLKNSDRSSDKDVFIAIGETIKNFPKPAYK